MEIHLSAMNAIRFIAAVLVMGAGGLALQLYISRTRHREISLVYLALGASAYGNRLFLQAIGHVGTTAILFITLFIPIPLILFMVETVATEWKKARSWIVAANLAVAVFAILTRILHWSLGLAWLAVSIFALVELPLIIAMLFFPRRAADRDLKITRTGISVFLLFAIYTNFQGLGWAPGPNVEFIGFVIVLSCLGNVALGRVLGNEERLNYLHKELEIARGIQTQLLPQPVSRIGKLEIGSRYVPASSVAGDFYDFLVQDGSLGVLLADVSGHGIPAALSASMVKVAVRAQMERISDPAEVLREMNLILSGNLQGQFVSAAYVFLNPAQSTLTYAGAGHPPLLVWRSRQQQIESLEENGFPLGIFSDGRYSAKATPLAQGDRCVLYTDGLVEAPGPAGEEFGAERLKTFITENKALPAQALCDTLLRRLSEWSGPSQQPHDDLTIVVVDFA
jgi:sigma-B regulation protein RsbU (phosphoserine phosphatase)